MPNLPTDAKARKNLPIATGVLDYFPDALAAVAEVSRLGNEQHNPGQPLHWSRGKSTDQADTLIRHFLERGTRDTDGTLHSAKVAWRALALLQLEIEAAAAEEHDYGITHDPLMPANPEPWVHVKFVEGPLGGDMHAEPPPAIDQRVI